MIATNVLDTPAASLPVVPESLPERRAWSDIFPETRSAPGMRLVMIWAPWSAHSLEAFTNLQEAREDFTARGVQVDVMAAADPGSRESDITSQLEDFHVTIPRIQLSPRHLAMTEARNQMPSTLLFRGGVLIDRKLGAQSSETLRDWVLSAAEKK